jgi:signal transduction histidine kinase
MVQRVREVEIERTAAKSNSMLIARNAIYEEELRARIFEFRRKVEETNKTILRQRISNNRKIVESLRRTNEEVIARHLEVRQRINQEAIRREVNVRVSRGLESLQEFISVLRVSNMSEGALKEAIQDPAISGSPTEKSKRASVSEFVKSIQRQLIQQSDFINVAAHELRTPITPILVNAEMLEADLTDKREEVAVIVRNAYRLQHLTQNILDVARIDSGSLRLRKSNFRLDQLITEIVSDQRSRLRPGVGIESSSPGEVTVNADRERITQVFSNILSNALKFTEKGLIEIKLETKDNLVLVSIKDSGPGIESELFPVLFSRFGKKSYSSSGMGLGLYISKSILEAHQGSIDATNNSPNGLGATVMFCLPMSG